MRLLLMLIAGEPGTLILAPSVVSGQWMDELTAHSTLDALMYTGLARHTLPQ